MEEYEKKIVQLVKKSIDFIDEQNISDHEFCTMDLIKLGVNSVNYIQLIINLEECFDLEIDDELLSYNTVKNTYGLIKLIDDLLAIQKKYNEFPDTDKKVVF